MAGDRQSGMAPGPDDSGRGVQVSPRGAAPAPPRQTLETHNELARGALEPLAAGERPAALIAASVAATALAGAVAYGTATDHDLRSHGGYTLGGVFIAAVLIAVAVGLLRRSYWAVVGFEALLALQILTASLALVLVTSALAAVGWLAAIALGGLLFWKLVGVMGRMQAAQAGSPDPRH